MTGDDGTLDLFDQVVFGGKTYEPEHDEDRLCGQLNRVWAIVNDGEWHTLYNIQCVIRAEFDVYDSEAAISARLRDFRKEKFGGHTVDRERLGGGLFRYRLVRRVH